jgi:hypothetical protein
MRIAAVNDDVSLVKMREQTLNHLIHGVACLDHQHDTAGPFQGPNKFLNRMRARDLSSGGFVLNEFVNLRDGAVEDGHAIAVVVHIQNQVLSHHGQADQTNVTTFPLHKYSC